VESIDFKFDRILKRNTAVGTQAGYSNTSGGITAVGYRAGYNNTSGTNLTALGFESSFSNVTSTGNTSIGFQALYANTAANNTAIGDRSLTATTTGTANTAIGSLSMRSNVDGGVNVALGVSSLFSNISGNNNIAVGYQSLFSNTASNNTALGYQAGQAGVANTTGANNIFIGYQATGVSATESNRTWIGNSSTTSTWLAGNVLIGTTTDAGYKLDVNGSVNIGSSSFSFASNLVTLTSSAGTSSLRIGGGNTLYVSGALTAANLAATDYVWVVRVLVGNGLARLTATTTDWLSITDSGQTSNGSGNLSAKFATFGTTYATINASAQVEIASIVKGFLQPRMTNAQAVAITSPATGLQLYDTTNNKNLLYNGTAWQNIATESWIAGQGYITSQPWVVSGSDIYYTTGRVGIGTTSPTDIFHIVSGAAANIFGRISSTSANGTAAWVAQNDQVDNVVYRVFGSGASGTQMGISLARSASLLANLGGSGKFLVGTYSSTDFVMGTGNQERIRLVDSTGNFLIGTTADNGNKLQVSGSIDSTGYSINNIAGYTGLLMIPGNPPGMQNVDIQGGIIVNVF